MSQQKQNNIIAVSLTDEHHKVRSKYLSLSFYWKLNTHTFSITAGTYSSEYTVCLIMCYHMLLFPMQDIIQKQNDHNHKQFPPSKYHVFRSDF